MEQERHDPFKALELALKIYEEARVKELNQELANSRDKSKEVK